ncbi:unnamed protein product [Rotaria sp. Silwood1]|nr:unnamed protein product [Rotaria sp. Silwood1]CAF1237578.1 unnamed protein product [Rotaria sp. Silwood1]CAF3500887.1 unnamed protein product [Rotaria sp. Silwood1]CAF3527909.1 unnamed protein product [Rotaria sp. Silwood1]CAF4599520.1 unnamed protein product [Rotaria sp. Silwood1]
MTTTNTQSYYSKMPNQDDQVFDDKNIQRFDADTIKNLYGNNWKNFASNIREVVQPDGSIIKEYVIEDPSLLEQSKTSSQSINSTITTGTDDDDDDQQQQSLKSKFAQIKAKFEQKKFSNVMSSPLTSSMNLSNITTRANSRKQTDDLYARHRRASNESIPIHRINNNYNYNNNNNSIGSSDRSTNTHHNYNRSQSITTEKSKINSFKRLDSADEADEEVREIHRRGEELRRYKQQFTPILSSNENSQQSRVQYEIVDEDGNPLVIDDIQDLIKMAGVHAREISQSDGSIIKEYVIDDPQIVSKYRSQQQPRSSMSSSYNQQAPSITSSYTQQQNINEEAPPPPPRIPLRPSILFRQGQSSVNDNVSYNIQQIRVLEPQRRYEYLTRTGRLIQFLITNSDSFNGQFITDSDIRELTHAINNRLLPSYNSSVQQQHHHQQPSTQTQFNKPKLWYPSVDFTHRQRIGSDHQLNSNNSDNNFQHTQTNLSRSASHGRLDQESYNSLNQQQVMNEPINNRNRFQYQDSHSQIPNQIHQSNDSFRTSTQFLPPRERQHSTTSPPINNNHPPVFYPQSTAYPYQGQQQHGVRILNDLNQQRPANMTDEHNRI